MKQTINVELPEGYIFDHFESPLLTNVDGHLSICLKKKNIKDFNFYIDEYLRTDECTTNDMLCNWMTSFEIDELKDNIRKGEYNKTPWEARIGLLKFICKDQLLDHINCLWNRLTNDKLKQICPVGFLESIIK